ncbi:MAG: hypothetical protein ABSH41_30425 [Syntrophobacteraceae bacterium]
MYISEAIDRSLPGFRKTAAANPDKLVVLATIPHNPFEPDGPGRTFIMVNDDIAKLRELMATVNVLYFQWYGDLYTVQDDKIVVCLHMAGGE